MKILFLVMFTAFGVGNLNAQSAHIVLQKYLEAVGGADKISKISSYYLHQVYISTPNDTTKIKQEITYYKAPYIRHELHYDGVKMLTTFFSPQGMSIPVRGDNPYKISGEKDIENFELYFLLTQLGGVRYILKAIAENSITFSDTVEIDGKLYYKFRAMLQGTINFYFNATTYWLERYDTGSGVYSVYSDFKIINGVLIPTVMTRYRTEKDEVYEKYELAMLDINAFIPDKYFSKRYLKF